MGDRGETDARGPWNEGSEREMVEAPAFKELESDKVGTRASNGHSAHGDQKNKRVLAKARK